MRGLLLVVLTVTAAANFEEDFEKFLEKYEKAYKADAKELAERKKTYIANRQLIDEENAKGHSYTLGENEFTDMTSEEFQMTHLGVVPDLRQAWGDLPHAGTHRYMNETLATSVDWRSKGAVTPVKNQKQCGSCWSFSTTGSLEGAWEIKTGNLVSLSEQQFVDCAKKFGNNGCSGGLMDNAFRYAEQAALCTETSYPYEAKNGICKASSCQVGIPEGGVTSFKDVASDEQSLMSAVGVGPVSIAIEADKPVFQHYKDGVLSATCGTKLDHGVLLVGYGTESNQDYWIVKNSWGPSWGQEGYIKLLRGKAGKGECGILSQPSYPIVSGKPGPSPGPSPPPSPPSPPTPPTPGTTHYEKPPCQTDEEAASIQGIDGSVCAPHCDSTACPTDVPTGCTATPKCMLQDSASGKKFCALSCFLGGCPTGARCAHIGLTGICVYPESSSKPDDEVELTLIDSEIVV